MPAKKYRVRLTSKQRSDLSHLVQLETVASYKRLHAYILLKADENSDLTACNDQQISEALKICKRTVERVRQRFVEHGMDAALNRAPRSRNKPHKLNNVQEAELVKLAASHPPEGHQQWTLRLLAQQMVKLNYVDTLSHETVRRVLKKHTHSSHV